MYFIFSSCELDLHTDVLRQGRKLRGIWNYSIYTVIVNHQRTEIRSLYMKCNYILELDKQRELMTIIYKRAFNSSLIKLKNLSSHITQTNPLERTLINPYWKCSYETAINLGPWNYFLTDNPYVWHHFELPCRWVTSQSLKINLTNNHVRASRSIDWGTVMMSSLFWMTQWPPRVCHSFLYV